jgi:hypothetical protein
MMLGAGEPPWIVFTYVAATCWAVAQLTPVPLIWEAAPWAAEPQLAGVWLVEVPELLGVRAWLGTVGAAVLTVGPAVLAVLVCVVVEPQAASSRARGRSLRTALEYRAA